MLDYAAWVLLHVACLLLILLASGGAGHLFLHRITFSSWSERITFTVALGLGTWAILLFLFGLLGVLYRQIILLITILAAAATAFSLAQKFKGKEFFHSENWKKFRSRRALFLFVLWLVGLAYWGVLLWTTQFPSLEWDGNSHQLVLSRYYLEDHRVTLYEGVPYPLLLALNNMLFTWALALMDDILAQMIQHAFLALIVLGLYSWGKRQNSTAFGLVAAASFLTHPLVLWLSESAYVDLGITCYVFLSVYASCAFLDSRNNFYWYLSIALAAMAAAVKLTGLFALLLVSLIGLWRLLSDSFQKRKQPRIGFPVFIRGLILGFLIAIPWYAFVAYHTGHPFWPQYGRIQHPVWEAPGIIAADYLDRAAARDRLLEHFVKLPLNWVYHPERFEVEIGTLSHLILLWPLSWIVSFWNRSARWWVLLTIAYTIFWFGGTHHDLRYWLPALPLATLALWESLRWILQRVGISSAIRSAIWISLAVCCLVWSYSAMDERIRFFKLPPVNADQRKDFLRNLGSGYHAVAYINEKAKQNDAIYMINASWLNYHLKPRVIDAVSFLQESNQPTFRWPEDEAWLQNLTSQNVQWILVNLESVQLPLPEFLRTRNPIRDPFWPDYEFVYGESTIYVFRRKTPSPQPGFVIQNSNTSNALTLPRGYEGYHDVSNCNVIIGWAWNKAIPNEPVELELYDGETLVSTFPADQFRRDLLEVKFGNGKHGFTYIVPFFIKDGKPHLIRIEYAGTNVELPNTGMEINCR